MQPFLDISVNEPMITDGLKWVDGRDGRGSRKRGGGERCTSRSIQQETIPSLVNMAAVSKSPSVCVCVCVCVCVFLSVKCRGISDSPVGWGGGRVQGGGRRKCNANDRVRSSAERTRSKLMTRDRRQDRVEGLTGLLTGLI